MPVGEKPTCRFGPFELDAPCGQLRKDGVGLKLQGQPVQILEILLEKPGQLVTREELRERLWTSDTFVDFDHSLNTAIKKLRQALGDEADTPHYIETLPRRGYRFIGEIESEEPRNVNTADPTEVDGDTVARSAATLADASIGAATEARKRLRWLALLVSAIVLPIVTVGAAAYWITKPPPMPRIVASHALTKTGYHKSPEPVNRLVTDGTVIYFREDRISHMTTVQMLLSGGEARQIATDAGDAPLRDISKDGSELLFFALNPKATSWDVWIRPLPSGPLRLVVSDGRWPTWISDGRGILFTRNSDRELWRINADGTGQRRLADLPDIDFTDPAVSPDGRHVRFAGSSTSTLWEVGPDGSNPHKILTKQGDSVAMGSWSPDGKYFFFRSWDGDRFNLWATSEEQNWWKRNLPSPRQLTFGPLWIGTPLLSRDGKRIYAVGREPHGELVAYDQRSGRYIPYLGGISARYVAFSNDGQWIAYVSYPDGTLWRSRIDGSDRRQLTVPPMAAMNPRWSPDGKLVAFMELFGGDRRHLVSKPRIYVVSNDGGGPMLLLTGVEGVGDPTWSRDGTAIAYAVGTREIKILDLQTQKSTKVPGSDGYRSPRWSPDGRYLVACAQAFPSKLVLYSFVTQRWEELASQHFNWMTWSRDSKFVYALRGNTPVRIEISNHKQEQVASEEYFPIFYTAWFGFTPDGRAMTTRDTGIEEIYAFDLEYK